MKTCAVVVIGHVDHGKTSLVKALTGIQTDRLAEEKQRGLSITTGFAHHEYPTGTIDFIDAPGHEDFIHAMVSGATGASAALIAISITEGIKAQTIEHLNIAGLLGIKTGVIAVTKSDLLNPAEQNEQLTAIKRALSNTPFADAKLILCSSLSGDGLSLLNAALQELINHQDRPVHPSTSFLPIDRVFSIPGRGTIVTGTLLGQDLSMGDAAILHPAVRDVTIRGLETRGTAREIARRSERTAVNLRGLKVSDIKRGDVLCVGLHFAPSNCIDIVFETLPTASITLKHNQDIRVLFGTSNCVANVRLFRGESQTFAQLRFKKPVVGFAGQRAILRHLSPPETIGGAVFLDAQSTPTRAGDNMRIRQLEAMQTGDVVKIANAIIVGEGQVVDLEKLARLSRRSKQDIGPLLVHAFDAINDRYLASKTDVAACEETIFATLAAYHMQHPLHAMAPRTVLSKLKISSNLVTHAASILLEKGDIRQNNNHLALRTHDPISRLNPEQKIRLAQIEADYIAAGLRPLPEVTYQAECDRELVHLLVELGKLISQPNIALNQVLIFHADTLANTQQALCAAFPNQQQFSTSEARTALQTSRRVIVPVLEYFDAQNVTVRDGNTRHMSNPI